MSGEGVTSHVIAGVALNRAARGEPLRVALGVPADAPDRLGGPMRTAGVERAAIVAYLHGLADDAMRVAEASLDAHHAAEEGAYRSAAQAIENGEHRRS